MKKSLLGVVSCLVICTGCSSFSRRADDSAKPPVETDAQKIERLQTQNKELTANLSALSSKIEGMDVKLGSMNDKIDATRTRLENLTGTQKASPTAVQTLPSEGAVNLPPAGSDEAEASFTSDDAVRKYRQAMILFESRNYPEAVLGFSAFVDQFPDHPLAGSAQYHLGESYFKQNEYKLAAREFNRVITTYDRSPQISETLKDLAISEDKLGQPDEAARHRQLLTSLFPHSPAAHSASEPAQPEQSDAAAGNAGSMTRPGDSRAESVITRPGDSRAESPSRDTSSGSAQVSDGTPLAPVHGTLDAPPPTAPLTQSDSTPSPGEPAKK